MPKYEVRLKICEPTNRWTFRSFRGILALSHCNQVTHPTTSNPRCSHYDLLEKGHGAIIGSVGDDPVELARAGHPEPELDRGQLIFHDLQPKRDAVSAVPEPEEFDQKQTLYADEGVEDDLLILPVAYRLERTVMEVVHLAEDLLDFLAVPVGFTYLHSIEIVSIREDAGLPKPFRACPHCPLVHSQLEAGGGPFGLEQVGGELAESKGQVCS
jgi:hypothetical protein